MDAAIKESLVALLAGIKRSDGAAIGAEMARLDALVERHRRELPPQLAHFLDRRSYAKALMLLGGESDIPSGTCRPSQGGRRPPGDGEQGP